MAIPFKTYLNSVIDIDRGTPGGDTYRVDGELKCFRFTSKHRRATYALTNEQSKDSDDIRDEVVDELLKRGMVFINDDDCMMGHGWMGCKVWDADMNLIGTIGDRCSHQAGHGTDHPGYGACRYHGTKDMPTRFMKHGRNASAFKRLLQEQIEAYATGSDRMALTRELGVVRTMMDMMLNKLGDSDPDDPDILTLITKVSDMAGKVARIVDKASSIEHRTAMTAGQLVYAQTVIVDVISKYVPKELLTTAAMELSERLGTKQAFGSAMAQQMLSAGEEVPMITTKRVSSRLIDDNG